MKVKWRLRWMVCFGLALVFLGFTWAYPESGIFDFLKELTFIATVWCAGAVWVSEDIK